jgi:hypothetical protein
MSNSTRWTLFGLLLTVNIVVGILADGTVAQLVCSLLATVGMVALLIEFLVRGRHRDG